MTRLRPAVLLAFLIACTAAHPATRQSIVLGALYPMSGGLEHNGTEELRGVEIAAELVNARGGIHGRTVRLDVRGAPNVAAGWREAYSLAAEHVPVIIGSYSSALSVAGSEAAHRNGVVWWETGAVADLVTSRGYKEVFRLGPSGATLASQAAGFAVEVLGPHFDIATRSLRIAVVYEDDPYGSSIGVGVKHEAATRGFRLVGSHGYVPAKETFDGIVRSLARERPDVVVAATYLNDGAAFRRRLVASHLPVRALIGKCAAFFTPDMAKLLGSEIDGVFVADKPMEVAPAALTTQGRALEDEFRSRFLHRYAAEPEAPAYMGFSGAYALLAYVLPRARSLSPNAIEAAAHTLDLPMGSLPNGAGVRFVYGSIQGQNQRALGVVWQWQRGKPVLVWPGSVARGAPEYASRSH